MTDKLVKEFEKIRASLGKSKKLILADIDKIDEKYRKLAQEEKKSLTESLGILNEQLKYYDTLLGDKADANGEDAVEAVEDAVEEPEITDTIFPENNEEEVKNETETAEVAEVVEESSAAAVVDGGNDSAADQYADVWPSGSDQQADGAAVKVVNREFPDNDSVTVGEDGWPEWPEA